jgi:hypothetical protein
MNWLRNWWRDQQILRQLQLIKNDVDARITYENNGTRVAYYVPVGTKAKGDCEMFATTYWRDCEGAGFNARLHTYKLPNGRWHVVAVVEDRFVLDCRMKLVGKV